MKIANSFHQIMQTNLSTTQVYQGMNENTQSQYILNSEHKNKLQVGCLENGEITKLQFEKLIKIQSALSFTIAISLFLIISAMEVEYSQIGNDRNSLIIFCLTFNCANTAVGMVISVIRFMTMLNLEKNRKQVYQYSTLFTTKKIYWVVLECLVIMVQPYPFFMDVYFQTKNAYRNIRFLFPLNNLLAIGSLVRTYIIVRGALLLTPYMSNRSNRLCKMYGCRADFPFSLKCLFKDNPLLLILLLFSASSVISAYAVYLAERNSNPLLCDIDTVCSYGNALWLVLMTVTTVGLGDYYPQTHFGRTIVFFIAIWGTFVISLTVVVVANTLKMQKKQKEATIVIEKLVMRDDERRVAAKFVGYFMLRVIATKKGNKLLKEKYRRKQEKLKKEFGKIRRQLKSVRNQNSFYDEIASKFLNLNNDIDILNSNQEKIISFIHQKLNCNKVQ